MCFSYYQGPPEKKNNLASLEKKIYVFKIKENFSQGPSKIKNQCKVLWNIQHDGIKRRYKSNATIV